MRELEQRHRSEMALRQKSSEAQSLSKMVKKVWPGQKKEFMERAIMRSS